MSNITNHAMCTSIKPLLGYITVLRRYTALIKAPNHILRYAFNGYLTLIKLFSSSVEVQSVKSKGSRGFIRASEEASYSKQRVH